jgi:hypothetical protein
LRRDLITSLSLVFVLESFNSLLSVIHEFVATIREFLRKSLCFGHYF